MIKKKTLLKPIAQKIEAAASNHTNIWYVEEFITNKNIRTTIKKTTTKKHETPQKLFLQKHEEEGLTSIWVGGFV